MELFRPAPEQFADVPDFDYDPSYVDVSAATPADEEVRMAYVEAGDGPETFLCLHGEPTWSFLYRKMIPRLADRGRVIAPDLLGFGRSDRFTDRDAYSVDLHYDALAAFVERLDLTDVTLVCQDWGGLLGLSLAAHEPERFSRLVPMNTGLPDGTQPIPDVWFDFAEVVETAEDLDLGRIVDKTLVRDVDDAVLDAYRAPFTTEGSKAAARTFPGLVPEDPDDPGADLLRESKERLAEWGKPAFVLFGDSDPIFHGARDPLRELIPTASEQPDVWVEQAGHFLQEDAGEAVAEHIVEFVDRT
jgi:haloalkane dehalogenase